MIVVGLFATPMKVLVMKLIGNTARPMMLGDTIGPCASIDVASNRSRSHRLGLLVDGVLRNPMITLYHILEHLIDVEAAVKHIWNELPMGSKVLIEVPDTDRLDEFAAGKPLSYFYYTHVLHLNRWHLLNLFIAKGFRCLDSGVRLRREEGLEMPCVWAVFEKGVLHIRSRARPL